jgi:hypothetical protein
MAAVDESVAIGKHMEASTHTYLKGKKVIYKQRGYRKGKRGISVVAWYGIVAWKD